MLVPLDDVFTSLPLHSAENLSSDMFMADINVQCIHGNREQYDREQALDDFRTGKVHHP